MQGFFLNKVAVRIMCSSKLSLRNFENNIYRYIDIFYAAKISPSIKIYVTITIQLDVSPKHKKSTMYYGNQHKNDENQTSSYSGVQGCHTPYGKNPDCK